MPLFACRERDQGSFQIPANVLPQADRHSQQVPLQSGPSPFHVPAGAQGPSSAACVARLRAIRKAVTHGTIADTTQAKNFPVSLPFNELAGASESNHCCTTSTTTNENAAGSANNRSATRSAVTSTAASKASKVTWILMMPIPAECSARFISTMESNWAVCS